MIHQEIFKNLEKEVLFLKKTSINNLINELENIGFDMIAMWIDYEYPILFNDTFLVEKDNYLFQITFSSGSKVMYINNKQFKSFKTIDLEKIPNKNKTLLGYRIDKKNNNHIEKVVNFKQPLLFKSGNLTYHDLLRKNKIKKFLENNV
jgi:hypothetical protein